MNTLTTPMGLDTADGTPSRTVRILGIRGLPAAHGGFETFAQQLAPFLRDRGWNVVVYCQADPGTRPHTDSWNGITRIHIPAPDSSLGTVLFDWAATVDAAASRDVCLTLGYNTAIFCILFRLRGIRNIINMDGIEWRRAKWSAGAKAWFWLNERLGCWFGNHLIADHPEIKRHLATRVSADKISVIPYGGVIVESASNIALTKFDLVAGRFLTVIARPEPENSIYEIVETFSKRRRGIRLVMLGKYNRDNPFHAKVMDAASDEVIFPGAIYDADILKSLRYHCLAYVHGHQVGGTNPSLVEAMAASNAVIAHNNAYNRWVAGAAGAYFNSPSELEEIFDTLLNDGERLAAMRVAGLARVKNELNWPQVLQAYDTVLKGDSLQPSVV